MLKQKVMNGLFSSAAALGVVAGMAQVAQAGPGGAPIDCAILLCMGSGFPSDGDGVCSAAKAEVVRRVTPNPHSEPPLQIWNCPLGASFQPLESSQPMARIHKAAEIRQDADEGFAKLWDAVIPGVDDAGTFNFIRSIRVYNIMGYSHREVGRDSECRERSSIQLGQYAENGNYVWSGLAPAAVPAWVGMRLTCIPPSFYRGVGFEWTDYEGTHGTHVVRY